MPDCGPPTVAEVNALAEFIARADRLLVITGAGVSTESNVPDYRSPNGAYSTGFKPMTHQEFMRSEKNQSRYWARSFAGGKNSPSARFPTRRTTRWRTRRNEARFGASSRRTSIGCTTPPGAKTRSSCTARRTK